jgi:hypothetical protein
MPGTTPQWKLTVKRGSHGKDLRDAAPAAKATIPRSK